MTLRELFGYAVLILTVAAIVLVWRRAVRERRRERGSERIDITRKRKR